MNNFDNLFFNIFPENQEIINAEGDRIYTENKEIFYNFHNESLRWLCGYNNQEITYQIEKEIQIIQENPDQLTTLYDQIKTVLCENIGKNYKEIKFLDQNTYDFFISHFNRTDNSFFITLDKSLYIPKGLRPYFLEFEQMLEQIPEKRSAYTDEGWSIKKIKALFSQFKKQIAGFVITPVLVQKGTFISRETCQLISQLCKKYKIPLIWDESLTAFFKTGTFYFLNQYSIDPDFITINTIINDTSSVNLYITTKKTEKRYLKHQVKVNLNQQAPALIIIHSNLLYISQKEIIKEVEKASYRLTRKLNALSANVRRRFTIKGRGIIIFINFNQPNLQERAYNYLIENKIILYKNEERSMLLLPQLTVSFRAVDILIQTLDNFFKNGIKLQ